VTGLFGGAFDPPHMGHVALARAALERFGLDRLVVLVVERPGHKGVDLPAAERLRLAHLAFAELARTTVMLEPEPYTVDALERGDWGEALFVVGADEFADFLAWKDPERVLDRVCVAVATRPGYPSERLERVLAELARPDRVKFFEIPAFPISSREIRARLADGEPVDGMVPEAVAREIQSAGLYR
jgi:nicotinate-nucleotide adenylyltransferase